MESLYNIITILIFLSYLAYNQHESKKEKVMLIQELTIALKSTNVIEYKDNIPEPKLNKIEFKKPQDELVPIEEIDPTQLLSAISRTK